VSGDPDAQNDPKTPAVPAPIQGRSATPVRCGAGAVEFEDAARASKKIPTPTPTPPTEANHGHVGRAAHAGANV